MPLEMQTLAHLLLSVTLYVCGRSNVLVFHITLPDISVIDLVSNSPDHPYSWRAVYFDSPSMYGRLRLGS